MRAEQMLGRAGAEAVGGEGVAAAQQGEVLVRHDQVAKAGHRADRAIAIEHLDRRRNLGREPDLLAMTAAFDLHGLPMHHCFPPVIREDTRLLVLGSLPGAASLAAGRYYAHPRNLFWRLIGAAIGRELEPLDYEARLAALLDAGVGLWDTVAAAERPGSLDADIRLHAASDLAEPRRDPAGAARGRLQRRARRRGSAARQLGEAAGLTLIDLPSSSPAYASLPFEKKLAAWRALSAFL